MSSNLRVTHGMSDRETLLGIIIDERPHHLLSYFSLALNYQYSCQVSKFEITEYITVTGLVRINHKSR